MARDIARDLAAHERTARESALLALRVGIRLAWLRDNGERGSLARFLRDRFKGKSERTLYNYLRIADTFLREAGLVDRKTLKLTDAKALAPLVSEQLELFSDPVAKVEGAMKKLLQWVGNRGLADIYRTLEAAPAATPKGGKPTRRATGDILADIEVKRSLALDASAEIEAFRTGESWRDLYVEEAGKLADTLHAFWREVVADVKKRRAHEQR